MKRLKKNSLLKDNLDIVKEGLAKNSGQLYSNTMKYALQLDGFDA